MKEKRFSYLGWKVHLYYKVVDKSVGPTVEIRATKPGKRTISSESSGVGYSENMTTATGYAKWQIRQREEKNK